VGLENGGEGENRKRSCQTAEATGGDTGEGEKGVKASVGDRGLPGRRGGMPLETVKRQWIFGWVTNEQVGGGI